jgi:Ca-activated chloride channel family protein
MAVALVIDTSGSMEGEKIRHARAAASAFLDTLVEGDQVSLITFDSSFEFCGSSMICSFKVARRH